MDGFDVYKTYLAIKLHFTRDDYNFDMYNGRTRASYDSFNKRNDRFFFHRIAKKYKTDMVDFLVSGFVGNHNTWVGDLNTSTAEQKYLQHIKRRDGFSYYFKLDMMHLIKKANGDFNKIFKCYKGQHPILLKSFLAKKIGLDTLSVLQKMFNYCKKFDKEIEEKIVWPKVSLLTRKYTTFLGDKDYNKLKEIIKQCVVS